jgi:hypothetical protein
MEPQSAPTAPDVGKLLMLAGVVLLLTGVLWRAGALRWFGRLPGDLRWESESGATKLFLPLTSMLLLSVGLSGVSWLVRWISRNFAAR